MKFSKMEAMATALICIAAIVAPLALGGTHPLAIAGLMMVMAVVVVVWAASLRPGLISIMVPLACLALPFVQLLPLPDRLLVALAPVSAGAWKIAHAGIPEVWGRISIDPAETAAAARRGFLAVGTFTAVAALAMRPRWRNCLVGAMAISGAIIWTLGLAFPVKLHSFLLLGFISFEGPLMPGRTPLEPPYATAGFGFPEMVRVAGHQYTADSWVVGDGFGPYLVTNHFAGALTLTIPFLAAAWLTISRHRIPVLVRHAVVAGLFTGAAATLGLLVQSRAGTASFGLAMLVFGCLSVSSRPLRWCIFGLTAAYTVALASFIVVLFGSFHKASSWFPTGMQPKIAAMLADDRVEASKVAMRMFLASPIFGTGLATYGDLYPVMKRDGSPWYFAHNEYAQLLAESGITGGIMAGIVLSLLAASAYRFQQTSVAVERTLGAAAWAAVSGILMHSCFDWNLRVPANLYLTCVACGLAIASGAKSTLGFSAQPHTTFAYRWLRVAVVLAVVTAAGFQIRDLASDSIQRQLRGAIVAARRSAADPLAPSPQATLITAVAAGERMVAWDPGNAQFHIALGQAYLHLATMPLEIDQANSALQKAAGSFRLARLCCAVCRGLAEPQALEASR